VSESGKQMGHKKKNQKNEQPIGGFRLFSSARILCLVSSSSDSFDRSPSHFILQFQSFNLVVVVLLVVVVVVVLHLECGCEAEDIHHQF
jgi:hypothetical protein